jgi:uncharacterized protein DUF4136
MKSILLVLVGAMTACGTASSSGAHVQTESSAGTTFATYHTFGFRPARRPAQPFEVSARDFEVERRMRPLIVAELSRKGYAEQVGESKPDFVVAFASGYASVAPAGEYPNYGAASAPSTEVEKNEIVVDAFDTSTDAQVWHGTAESKVNPEKIDDPLLQASVERLLAPFPARSSGSGLVVTSTQ